MKIERLLRQIQLGVLEQVNPLDEANYAWLMRQLAEWTQKMAEEAEDADSLLINIISD